MVSSAARASRRSRIFEFAIPTHPYNWMDRSTWAGQRGRVTPAQRYWATRDVAGRTPGRDLHDLRRHLRDPASRDRPGAVGSAHRIGREGARAGRQALTTLRDSVK